MEKNGRVCACVYTKENRRCKLKINKLVLNKRSHNSIDHIRLCKYKGIREEI